jgi:hypothetical protein
LKQSDHVDGQDLTPAPDGNIGRSHGWASRPSGPGGVQDRRICQPYAWPPTMHQPSGRAAATSPSPTPAASNQVVRVREKSSRKRQLPSARGDLVRWLGNLSRRRSSPASGRALPDCQLDNLSLVTLWTLKPIL